MSYFFTYVAGFATPCILAVIAALRMAGEADRQVTEYYEEHYNRESTAEL